VNSLVLIVVVIAVAAFAILARMSANTPKKADKWEKAEIIKQLLALSDDVGRTLATAPPAPRKLRDVSGSAIRSETMRQGTSRKNKPKATGSPRSAKPAISISPKRCDAEIEGKIRQRAYELYRERGGVGGNPTDYWLRAKREVLSRKA